MSVTKLIEHVLEEVSIDGSEGIFNILFSFLRDPYHMTLCAWMAGQPPFYYNLKFLERKSISIGLERSDEVSVLRIEPQYPFRQGWIILNFLTRAGAGSSHAAIVILSIFSFGMFVGELLTRISDHQARL